MAGRADLNHGLLFVVLNRSCVRSPFEGSIGREYFFALATSAPYSALCSVIYSEYSFLRGSPEKVIPVGGWVAQKKTTSHSIIITVAINVSIDVIMMYRYFWDTQLYNHKHCCLPLKSTIPIICVICSSSRQQATPLVRKSGSDCGRL